MVSVFHLAGGTVQGVPTQVGLFEHDLGITGFFGKGFGGKEEMRARKNQECDDISLCMAIFHLLRVSHE
jgi:hypothetical protein